jgi:hypothetical protein
MTMKTYYVGCGSFTCPDAAVYWGVRVGDPEWQFSDGPVGERSMSYDYPTIEAGLRELSPCIIIFEDE